MNAHIILNRPPHSQTAYNQIFAERQSAVQNRVNSLLSSQQLPEEPFSDIDVQHFLGKIALGDCNNFQSAGVGEREGRVYSQLVRQRNCGLAHGVGRSGNLLDEQPKAAGSNLLHRLTRNLLKHSLQLRGFQAVKGVLVLPVATGMAFNFVVQALQLRSVAWLRCDQKSVPKALELAGCQIHVVDCVRAEESMAADLAQLQRILETHPDVQAVVSTTSCFAPRRPDDVRQVSRLCRQFKKIHLVNNAYGIQSDLVMRELNACEDVDVVVSSLDKNYMVPVGGSIVYSRKAQTVEQIGRKYAGRASIQPILDVCVTLLQMGRRGWERLQDQRRQTFERALGQLQFVRVPRNEISMYRHVASPDVGAYLFRRGISGARVDGLGASFKLNDIELRNFGCHGSGDDVLHDYVVFAVAVGMREDEVDTFQTVLGEAERR